MMSLRRFKPQLTVKRWPAMLLALVSFALVSPIAWAKAVDSMTVFEPVSPPARDINGLFILTLAICAVILVLVGGAMLWFSIRYRRRPHENDDEPPQLYGSHRIEIAWTLGPLLVVFVLFLVVFRVVAAIQGTDAAKTHNPNDLQVTVIGHQWWWEFKYPGLGITTANELHVPLSPDGKKNTVALTLKSADVIHDFWVPQLCGKQDVVPGHTNYLWFAAQKTGTYFGQCAEFCGAQHANMAIRVVVQTPEAFKKWVADHQQPAADPATLTGAAKAGHLAFMNNSCIQCHEIQGATPDLANKHGRYFGPNLTHLMTRKTIGAGVLTNTPAHLAEWIRDPQVPKPGCNMPSMLGSGPEAQKDISNIVAYLETLN